MMEDNSRGLHFRCHSLPLPQVFSCSQCGGSIWIILAIGIWSLRDKRSVPGGTAETFLCQWAPADGSGNAVISYTDITCVTRTNVVDISFSHFGREKLALTNSRTYNCKPQFGGLTTVVGQAEREPFYHLSQSKN